MSVYLIRHGKTQGNVEGRFIGARTDEPLCEAGRISLLKIKAPSVARVYVSDMLRCVETARILFPGAAPIQVHDFRELDFGAFDGKNHRELDGRADYQAWIDARGEVRCPGGESREAFCTRCVRAFEALLPELRGADCAIVAHGGTIMAILQHFAVPERDFYDYQVKNGRGYVLEEDGTYRVWP